MYYFIVTLIMFSSMEVVSKPLMGLIDPFVLTFWRFGAGFAVFALLIVFGRRFDEIKALTQKAWISLFLLGFINVFFSMSMLQLAVKNSSAAMAATVFCSNPLFVFIYAVLLKDEKFSLKKMSGFLLGIAGIIAIMAEKGLALDYGVIFALLASMSFAAYTTISKRTVKTVAPVTVNAVSFFFGICVNMVFLLISGRDIALPPAIYDNAINLTAFLYLSVVISAYGYITFINTIKKYSAVSASVIFLLKPACATILAVIFLHEMLTASFYSGLALIIAGSALILKK